MPFLMHGNGIDIELEVPLSFHSINRTRNAQVLGIPVEWALDADLGSSSLREEMPELLDVERIVTEVYVSVSC